LANDQDIDRHPEAAHQTPQPDRLANRVANRRLDDQDIDIGTDALISAGARAEEHDPRPCRGRFS
jgi:hypothetical protein